MPSHFVARRPESKYCPNIIPCHHPPHPSSALERTLNVVDGSEVLKRAKKRKRKKRKRKKAWPPVKVSAVERAVCDAAGHTEAACSIIRKAFGGDKVRSAKV